eukprot:TRINITY_DN8148_c0_g1_i1.p1 TRINITY_DN8148_c0_g1~~TRINITY_DN8148_c0_g1_i1.p1  ORF type:complete len:695 (-),score=188.01 TRINITY_DN8148_c0_g1_i1:523-2538(-)
MSIRTSILLALVCLTTIALCVAPRKQLAGPPSDFNDHSIWNEVVTVSESAMMNMNMREMVFSDFGDSHQVVGVAKLPVDATEDFEFVFGSPFAEKMTLKLESPSGVEIDLEAHRQKSSFPVGSTGESVPADYFFFKNLEETGFYTLTVTLDQELASDEEKTTILTNSVPDAFILIESEDNIQLEASLISPIVCSSSKAGLKVRLVREEVDLLSSTDSEISITEALLDVHTPSGEDIEVQMNDDGLFEDEEAGDHYYTGSIVLNEVGDYQFEAIISGWVDSKPFMKSIEYLIPSAQGNINIAGSAALTNKDNQRVLINIDIDMGEGVTESELPNFRGYSEVYGINTEGKSVPVAWIGSIVNIIDEVFTLELNLDWLNLAQVQGPLTLKNTYLVNLKTETVIAAHREDIPVSNSKIFAHSELNRVLGREITEITDEMRYGVNPLKGQDTTSGHSIILLHGYCSGSNPWPVSDFDSNAAFFLNADANIANDDFAQLVIAYAEGLGTSTFSIIGHSQGGMVGLHILNYYFTGLDNSPSARKIQTVGTPWKGCSAAGSIASIGSIFGVACGQNTDLTTSGASNWLSGISSSLTSEVYFYTTTYKLGTWLGDSCSTAANIILKWPNDGTAELKYATLPGGNDMGNTQKQCHTTDMNYSAQYLDASRNSILNANAQAP